MANLNYVISRDLFSEEESGPSQPSLPTALDSPTPNGSVPNLLLLPPPHPEEEFEAASQANEVHPILSSDQKDMIIKELESKNQDLTLRLQAL